MNEALFIGDRNRIVKALHLLPGWEMQFAVEKNSLAHKTAIECGLNATFYEKTDFSSVFKLLKFRPWNLVICAGCPMRIPTQDLSPITFTINCHPGMLPDHPGKHPITSAIYNSFDAQGVTIQSLAQDKSNDKILLQKSLGSLSNCDLHELYNLIYRLEAELLIEVLRHLPYYQQNSLTIDRQPKPPFEWSPTKEPVKITNLSCMQLLSLVRMHAFSHLEGVKLGQNPSIQIWDASPIVDVNYLQFYPSAKVGQIVSLYEVGHTERFILCLKDGFVRVNVFNSTEKLFEGQILID